ncbi:MAG: protein-disulfide reductase DsbD [Gammaproteobacteria bacterium]|nr:protein-disulfide reductase DsbD [Gammaproteobacteria bacterium]
MRHNHKYLRLLCLPLFLLTSVLAQANEEPLMPDVAFKFSAKVIDANTVRAEWDVADKYYLYRDKIRFTTDTPEIGIAKIELPKGKLKHGIRPDGTEGEVETFSHKVSIDLPLLRNNPELREFTLIAHSQGCAEIGICYPPQKQKIKLQLPAAEKTGAVKKLSSLSDSLGLSNAGQDILSPDEAFQLNLDVADANTIIARWVIAQKHYMYRDKINVKLINVTGARLEDVIIPEGKEKEDVAFKKKLQVFYDHAEAKIKLVRSKAEPLEITLELTYQGCAEEVGICYPPTKKKHTVILPAASDISKAQYIPEPTSDLDRFNRLLSKGSLLTVIVAAFGFGILLAFTACMYPMIPILSSIIVGQGEKVTMAKGFFLSLIYVLSMAITFGIIGGIMAYVGGGVGLQAYFQSPWLLIPFALLFIALSISMFGFYNIQVPAFIQSRLSNVSNQQKGGTLIGVAFMGVLSALIIGPCGGPILIAALSYAGASGDVFNGFIALFSLGMGMGLPLLVVGASGGKLLPRAGDWMNVVKAVAGAILLAIAIVILERMPNIFSSQMTMTLWSALIIVSGIYMGALEPLRVESTGWRKLWKGLGFTMIIYGIIVMLGGLTGGSYVSQPLHGSSLTSGAGTMAMSGTPGSAATQTSAINFKKVKSVADLEREKQLAQSQGKMIMLDFYADWCVYCKEYESFVFPNPDVQQRLNQLVLLKADVTAMDDSDKDLMKANGVLLPPALIFFDKQGQEMRNKRIVGSIKAEKFVSHLDKVMAQ